MVYAPVLKSIKHTNRMRRNMITLDVVFYSDSF